MAVVAGATRGAGRGIAAALGEAGATVICTGRSSVSGNEQSDYDRPETIEETADLVTQLGGTGIAVQVDHLDIAAVSRLADRIARRPRRDRHPRQRHLGCGGTQGRTAVVEQADLGARPRRRSSDPAARHRHAPDHVARLLPLLVGKPGGLLVEVTDGTKSFNDDNYRLSVFYDLAKTAVNRLAYSHGHELHDFGATAVAVTPGWLRSEMMLDNWGVTEENWHVALDPLRSDGPVAPPGFAASETPRYVGRGVAAIAADARRARFNQQSVTSAELAREYGFTDLDGRQPDGWAPG